MKGDPLLLQMILQVLLIMLNAVFACAEIAVITTNDAKLAKLAAAGDKRAARLAKLTSQPARFLATIQVAITLAGFLGSAFAAENFSDRLVSSIMKTGVSIPVETLDTVSVIVITLILSYFTLVLGELVPKRIAMKNAEKLALGMSGLIYFISKLFAPLVWLLTISTNGILRLFGIDPNAEDEEVTEEEIRMMVDVGSEKGAIDVAEREMIQNVFEFDDIAVADILTHRTQVDMLWMDETDEQWEETIHGSRHSSYPICADSADNVVGVLNVKDYFRLADRSREEVMCNAVSPARFVMDTLKADALFSDMKKSRNHFAIVLDEYGGMSGIVTMNDLLEEIVGDLPDEEEQQETFIEKIDDNTWRMHGSVPLDAITDELGIELPSNEFDTLNGLAFSTLNCVPEDGAQFEANGNGLIIRVTQIKNHQIVEALVSIDKKADCEL
ncbi:MAG: hemolysin family protein [Clostridia bacterium]